MLDIRLLAATCKRNNLILKCLGYDCSAKERTNQTEVNISRNEISYNISEDSVIIPDNFSVLKDKEAHAFQYLNKHGPFDIINLDLCESISDLDDADNHDALKNLCEFQINKRREPWLIFLTTRAEYSKINNKHFSSYISCIKKNAKNSKNFHILLKELTTFDISSITTVNGFNTFFGKFEGPYFVKLFAAGFGKWLFHLFPKNDWEIEMLDSCYYRVENNQQPDSFPNMLSLAFCISPVSVILNDKSGLTKTNPKPKTQRTKTGTTQHHGRPGQAS